MYHVIRSTTNSPHYGGDDNEFVGSYWTTGEANDAAHSHLNEAMGAEDPEDLDEYESGTDDDGLVGLSADVIEGETVSAYVQQRPLPKGTPPPAVLRTITSTGTAYTTMIGMVLVTRFDDELDKVGQQCIWGGSVFDTMAAVNAAVLSAILEACGVQDVDNLPDLFEFTKR